MGVDSQSHATATLLPRKRAGTHYKGGWVGPRASLDGNGKSHPPLGFDLQTIQPIQGTIPTILLWSTVHKGYLAISVYVTMLYQLHWLYSIK